MKNLIFNWRPEGLPEDWELLLAADPSQRIIATYLEKSAFLEARREGEWVGLLLLATTSSAERGEIVNLSVRPSEQNQGIGSQLLQQALAYGKRLGYRRMEVATATTSFGPLYLYQKNGFRVTSVEQDYYLKCYDEVLMENGLVVKDRLILTQSL